MKWSDGLRLSVALCTCNGEKYLGAQLECLLAQMRLPDEIVVGDDGSGDTSWSMLEVFSRCAADVGIVAHLRQNRVNVGYVENFSTTLGTATGDVILLCDQDDVWRMDKTKVMAECFERDPRLLLLHSDARLVDAAGADMGCTLFEALQLTRIEIDLIHAGRAFEVLARRSCVTGATMAFRRELVELALPVGEGWIHDEWLAVIAAAVGKVDVIEQPLIDYRQHGSNQLGMRPRAWRDKWRDLRRARGALLRAEIARLRVLGKRLDALGGLVTADKKQLLAARGAHLERRIAIGALPHWRRWPAVWREARDGFYRRFSTGGRSLLRDLLRRD